LEGNRLALTTALCAPAGLLTAFMAYRGVRNSEFLKLVPLLGATLGILMPALCSAADAVERRL
jgi:hypothetical protein